MTIDPTDIPTDITFSAKQRELLAKLAEQTGKSYADLIDEWLSSVPLARPATESVEGATEKTLYDVLSERGMLGCFDGPTDLATNPKYMEGFGRDAWSHSD